MEVPLCTVCIVVVGVVVLVVVRDVVVVERGLGRGDADEDEGGGSEASLVLLFEKFVTVIKADTKMHFRIHGVAIRENIPTAIPFIPH